MSGFTPGPWSFEPHDGGQYFGNIVGSYGKNENGIESIRTITCQLKYGGDAENLANAHLIAAAPELFMELQSADVQLEQAAEAIEAGRYDEALLHCRSMVRQRRAALAKAEGKP